MVRLKLTPSAGFVQRRSQKQPFVPREADAQRALFEWASWAKAKYPDLDLLFGIMNGVPLHGEQRFATINWLKNMGLKPGVPDIALMSARGGYHGLFIEMKTRGQKPNDLQCEWLGRLSKAGYKTAVCESYEQAIADLEIYCRLPKTVVASVP